MRTTLSLPDDVYEAARRGLGSSPGVNLRTAFPTFDIRPDSRKITMEETLAAEEDC